MFSIGSLFFLFIIGIMLFKYFTRIILVFFIILFIQHYANANDKNYTISGVYIKELTDDNNVKQNALTKAKAIAWQKLLIKLDIDKSKIESLGQYTSEIDKLIFGIKVQDEKFSANYYSAVFTVSFIKQNTNNFLTVRGIEYSNFKYDKLVIIPMLQTNTKQIILNNDSVWFNALSGVIYDSNKLNIILPDNKNEQIVFADELSKNDQYLMLSNNIRKNNAKGGLFVAATLVEQKAKFYLRIDAFNEEIFFPLQELALPDENIYTSYVQVLLENAAKDVIKWLDTKSELLVKSVKKGSINKYNFIVNINNTKDWVDIKKIIAKSTLVKNIDINSVDLQRVDINIVYNGTKRNIVKLLKKNNLVVMKKKDKWYISKNDK